MGEKAAERIFERLCAIVNGCDLDDPDLQPDYLISPPYDMTYESGINPSNSLYTRKYAGEFCPRCSGSIIWIGVIQDSDGDTYTEFHIKAGENEFFVVTNTDSKNPRCAKVQGSERDLWLYLNKPLRFGEAISLEEAGILEPVIIR